MSVCSFVARAKTSDSCKTTDWELNPVDYSSSALQRQDLTVIMVENSIDNAVIFFGCLFFCTCTGNIGVIKRGEIRNTNPRLIIESIF